MSKVFFRNVFFTFSFVSYFGCVCAHLDQVLCQKVIVCQNVISGICQKKMVCN